MPQSSFPRAESATTPEQQSCAAEPLRDLSQHHELAHLQPLINIVDAVWSARRKAESLGDEIAGSAARSLNSRFGRFTLREMLGEGGFGVVFLAFDPALGRPVALKLPRLEVWSSALLRERFLREGMAAAALDHPNILPVHEAGEVGGIGYIVSMYCPGPTLARWMKDAGKPCLPRIAAEIVSSLARAVQHAHERGVLHRDIKPSNVLLEPRDQPSGQLPFVPRLADFGLAKQLNEATPDTATGVQAGTPWYMAPEQLGPREKSDVGVFTDVYALGIVLYELLTGKVPFDDPDPLELARDIRETDPSAVRAARPEVSRDLETICLKCLEKRPANRYRSAAELADDLQRYLDGDEVLARPLGWGAKWARRCRRNKLVTTLCCLVVTAVALGIGGIAHQWRSANRYAAAVEQSLIEAEMGLVNMAWVLQERDYGAENTDPFLSGNLERLIAHYERMLARPAPSRPSLAYQATMESFRARVAELKHDEATASRHFENTIRLWDQLVKAHPDDAEYRQALVLNLFSYGAHLKRFGDTTHPLSKTLPVEELYEYLLSLEPRQGRIAAAFAEFLQERGKTLVRLDQARMARDYFMFAHGLAHLSVKSFPDDRTYHRLFARAVFFQACAERRNGLPRLAIDHFTETNQWLDLIMHSEKPTAEDLLLRADASLLQAACMRDVKRFEEAVTMFETALHFFQRLENSSGGSPVVWNLSASTVKNLAELYARSDKPHHSRLNQERFCDYVLKSVRLGSATGGDCHRLPIVLMELAETDVAGGEIARAEERLRQACEAFERFDTPEGAQRERRLRWADCLAARARLAREQGNMEAARTYHENAIALLRLGVEKGSGVEEFEAKQQEHQKAMELLSAS